jgi:ssDNA-binding Zn-finger/Zn-ribbon topoisomerase 1
MKFKLHTKTEEFLKCDSCSNEDFDLLPEKKISAEEKYKDFLFYECPNCAGAGFWTHGNSINKKHNFGIAIARCKAIGTLRFTTA